MHKCNQKEQKETDHFSQDQVRSQVCAVGALSPGPVCHVFGKISKNKQTNKKWCS